MTEKRPSTNCTNNYPAPFSLRLNSQERQEMQRLAAGQPLGRFIKDAILKHGQRPAFKRTPLIVDQKALAKLLGALGQSRIASNINQLAKAANSGSLPVNKDVIDGLNDAVEAIRWMRDTLIKAIGIKPQNEHELGCLEDQHDSQG